MKPRHARAALVLAVSGGLFVLAGGLGSWMSAARARDKAPGQAARMLDVPAPTRTIEGTIVNLCDYLSQPAAPAPVAAAIDPMAAPAPAPTPKAAPNEPAAPAFDGPIGLTPNVQGPALAKTAVDPPGGLYQGVYLLTFSADHHDAFATARGWIGKQVRMSGRLIDRDGLHALEIEKVELTTAPPTGQPAAAPGTGTRR
ncbi:MAG: hypothetical protein BIFFINMI_00799 [Phycisphaerae bacterium]|nr:hypothetical protein [Phycisphaerae bacterium]